MKLTDEQETILANCDNNCYVSAAPGSGKSTMLSKVAEQLLRHSSTHSVMLITFTNKAAKSIISKCEGLDTRRIIGGTFHSIAYRTMRQHGMDIAICDESKKRTIIKKRFNCRKDRDKFEALYDTISLCKAEWPQIEDEAVKIYNEELKRYGLFDFDDIIYTFIDGLRSAAIGMPNITHCLVDELQDTSGPQLEMLKQVQDGTKCKMIGVADDDQCHPSGNRVLTTDGYVDISLLDPEVHRVPAYDGHGKLYGLNNPHGYKIEKSSRIYNGPLYTISTEENRFSCTYNHKCYVQWIKEKANKIYVTYLMKRNERFRIGQCKLIQRDGCLHLGIRARIEKADSVWILSTHTTRKEAIIQETILATQFRIPTITFEETSSSVHLDQGAIDSIFNELDGSDLYGEAVDLLDYFNRDMNYPLWTKADCTKQGARTFFITQACNIIPNIMCVGEYNGSRKLVKKEIKDVKCEWVSSLKVYSLNVEKFHNYVCNQILVSNSIYVWRGARPQNVRDFIDHFKCRVFNMGFNFRSAKRIVESSAKLIVHNRQRIEKTIRPFRREDGSVIEYPCLSPFKEIDYTVVKCLQHSDRDIAILYRNRMWKYQLEFELKKAKVPYRVNDFTDLTDRSAVRVLVACLKIAARKYDIYDLKEASKALKGLGKKTVEDIEERLDKRKEIKCIVAEFLDNKKWRNRVSGIKKMYGLFDENRDTLLSSLLQNILACEKWNSSFDVPSNLRSFMVETTSAYRTTEEDIVSLTNDLGLNAKEEQNDEGAKVELSTVHGYKGLEKDIVIMPWCQAYLERLDETNSVEDERRLFYVAATRAMNKLYLTYSGPRPQFVKEMKL